MIYLALSFITDFLLHYIWYPELYNTFINIKNLSFETQTILYERFQQVIKRSDGEVPKLYDISEQLLEKSFDQFTTQVILVMLRAKTVNLALVNEIYNFVSHTSQQHLRIYDLLSKVPKSHNRILDFMINTHMVGNTIHGNKVTAQFINELINCYPEMSSSNELSAIADRLAGMTRDQCVTLEEALAEMNTQNTIKLMVNDTTNAANGLNLNSPQAQPASFPWGKVAMATVAVVVVVGGLALTSGLGWVSL